MGHVFGSSHSLGGIMNGQYTTEERSFFKDIEGQEYTAAAQISSSVNPRPISLGKQLRRLKKLRFVVWWLEIVVARIPLTLIADK